MNNPPVNGLGYATRVGIAEGLEARRGRSGCQGHRASRAAAKAFSGGADITEFTSPGHCRPNLLTLIRQLEACAKPVVAAWCTR